MKRITYILSANSNKATLYAKNNKESNLKEIKYFECPEAKFHNTDLVSEKNGRVIQQSCKRSKGLSSTQTQKERCIEMFAKSLSEYIDKARKDNEYDELIIASSPKFLGILHSKLNQQITKTITRVVNKDLSQKKNYSTLEALL